MITTPLCRLTLNTAFISPQHICFLDTSEVSACRCRDPDGECASAVLVAGNLLWFRRGLHDPPRVRLLPEGLEVSLAGLVPALHRLFPLLVVRSLRSDRVVVRLDRA